MVDQHQLQPDRLPHCTPGALQVVAGNDSRLTNSRAPSGAAAGDLTGSYPAPIADGSITDSDLGSTLARWVSSTTDVTVQSYFFQTLNSITGMRIVVVANGLSGGGAGTVTIRQGAIATCSGSATVIATFSIPAAATELAATYVSPAITITQGSSASDVVVCAKATSAAAPLILRSVLPQFYLPILA